MRKWIKILIWTLLLTAVVVVCIVRWQAWFGMPDEPVWTGEQSAYRFPTFGRDSVPGFLPTEIGWQDSVSPRSLDILLLGDIHSRLQRADYDSLAARVPQADAVVQLGDWMERGQNYYYQLLVREWTHSRLCGLPVINCPGNHEYTKDLHKTLLPEWSEWFPQPLSNTAVPGIHYYVDFPQLRLIVLDTNPIDPLVYRTRTLTWLRRAMQTAGERYVVVMMHHPVYSAAKGRFNLTIFDSFILPLSEVDLVLAGHDHNYMRRSHFLMLNTSGKAKPQKANLKCDVLSDEPVYAVLSIATDSASAPLCVRTYRMSDGVLIDSVYVDHH